MRYNLVALFNNNSYTEIEEIQKNICKKYKLYKNVPFLHIPLEIIGDPDMNKLDEILLKILKPYKKFKVELSNIVSFDEPVKSLNLKIESKGYIERLARTINTTLKLHGFEVRDNIENAKLHIPLANTNYVIRELSKQDYIAASSSSKEESFYKLATVDKIELWKYVNNKKESVIKSYSLRDY